MKLFNRALLLVLSSSLLYYCHRDLSPDWYKQVVSAHMYEHAAYGHYYPEDFIIIDQAYLENQEPIRQSMQALSTLYSKLEEDLPALRQDLPPLQLDTLPGYVQQYEKLSETLPRAQHNLVKDIAAEIEYLDQILGYFDLNVYHPIPKDSLLVYHAFTLDSERQQSLFEIDLVSRKIVSIRTCDHHS